MTKRPTPLPTVLLLWVLAVLAAAPLPVLARDEGSNPVNPDTDPGDAACVEAGWDSYYYRLPVIFQEVTAEGKLQFVAFGYADACKKNKNGRGATHANILGLDGAWAPDVMAKAASMNEDLHPVDVIVPAIDYKNALWMFKEPIPDIPARFRELYNDQYKLKCAHRQQDGEVICPGIPPEFGKILDDAGFIKNGSRWLLDESYEKGKAHVLKQWTDADGGVAGPEGNFYGRYWAEALKNDHSGGGLFRLILFPVNLSATNCAVAAADGSGTVKISAQVHMGSARSVHTKIGWRLKGESNWRLGLDLPAGTIRPWEKATLIFPVSGATSGQVVQVMVNYDYTVFESTSEDPAKDAPLADNACEVALSPTVSVHDLWYSPAPPKPGDRVKLSVALTNMGAAATDTSVSWSVDGVELGADQTPVAVNGLAAGEDRRIAMPGSFPAPKAPAVKVQACITGTANCVARDVPIQQPPTVTMTAPSTWPCQGGNKYWVTWTVKNTGATPLGPVQRVVKLRTGKSGEQVLKQDNIVLDPGESRDEGVQVPVLSPDQDVQLVTVTLNPDQPLASDTAATAVSCDPPPATQKTSSMTVIVPDDCNVNPDLTSGRPCLNYAPTIPGWADH